MSASIINFPPIDGMVQVDFTSSGSFVVPNGITKIFVLGCGGGGGGSSAAAGNTSGQIAYGGTGAPFAYFPMNVSPGESLTIDVGIGGAGAVGTNQAIVKHGSNGTSSQVVGSLQKLRFPGACGGTNMSSDGTIARYYPMFSGIPGGGGTQNFGVGATNGLSTIFADPGTFGTGTNSGGGGGASIGNGGNGGNRNQSGFNGGIGAGGGAGGGADGVTSDGGDGGDGIITIFYAANN